MRRAGLVCSALSPSSDSRSQGDAESPGPRVEQTQRVWKPADVGPQGPDPTLACAPPSLSPTRSLLPEGRLGLTDACNAACGCQPEHYSPVCGPDGLMYYSPCHAGCPEAASPGPGGQKVSLRGCCPGGRWRPDAGRAASAPSSCNQRCRCAPQVYRDCSCVPQNFSSGFGHATAGKCTSTCQRKPLLLLFIFVVIIFTFLSSIPALTATLR